MASNLHVQAGVHLRDALERLYLKETHFILHPQLISYIHASGIASKRFKTTSSPSVPSRQPTVSAGIFTRFIIA